MPQTSAALCSRVLTTTAELEALAPEWQRLWSKDPQATPFQSPLWLLPWWKWVGEGALFAVAVFRKDALAGLLPLYCLTDTHKSSEQSARGRRKLLLLGAGTTDYLGGVFDPEQSSAPVESALRCVLQYADKWEEAHVYQLAPGSPLMAFARAQSWPEVQADPCFRVPLSRSGYLAGKLADNLRYYRRRAERMGELRFTRATVETAASIFDAFVDLHTRRWKERGEAGVLASEAVRQSHRMALPAMLKQGIARLYSLTLDDRVIAVNYCLLDPPSRKERSFYYYLNGFDPEYGAVSPGTLLLGHVAEEAVSEGSAYLDMLRGQEPYKMLWRAEPRATFGFALPHTVP